MADMTPPKFAPFDHDDEALRAMLEMQQAKARHFARVYDEWIDQERAREAFVNDGGDPEFIERMERELGVTHEP